MAVDNKTLKTHDNDHFIKKSFTGYLLPSILSILGGNISIMVDNCIAGAVLGEQALAAIGIANPVFNLLTLFGLLIGGGASAMASISIGQSNNDSKKRYFTLSFYMLLIAAAVTTVLGLIFIDPLVTALGASAELFPLVKDYARMLIIFGTAVMFVFFPLYFFRIEGKAKVSMIMFFMMAILDIIFDLVFVLVFHWGMSGLALATGLSSLIAVLYVFPSLFSHDIGYSLVKLKNLLPDIKMILKTGSPLALGNLHCVVRVRIFNALLISCGGSLALAAYGCANSVNNIGLAVVSGVAQTVGPLVGVLYGERDKEGIKRTVSLAMKLGGIITFFLWILVVVFSRQLAALFGMVTPEQIKYAVLAISILNFNLVSSLAAEVFIYYYMTTERTAISNLLTLCEGLIFRVAFAFIGSELFGFTGLLAGLALSGIFSIIPAFISAWIKKKKENCDSILLLSRKLFDCGYYLSKTVLPTSEDISKMAEMAGNFCSEHGLTTKQAMTVSLGIEEIMVLMARHAIENENDCLEFRLFITEYETILRLRCAGKWFDPLHYECKDEMENLSVKMLLKMALDISYSTNLGMNNVKITIAGKGRNNEAF